MHRNSHTTAVPDNYTDGIPDCRCGCGMASAVRVESVDKRGVGAFVEYCCSSAAGYLGECAREEGVPFVSTVVRDRNGRPLEAAC